MHLAVTGGTGLVGHFIVRAAIRQGLSVSVLARKQPAVGSAAGAGSAWRPFDLDDPDRVDLGGVDALVHAAFDHLPGRYRGGEGADPTGFHRRNALGSRRLVDHAGAAGCRVIFLSSRAVYGGAPDGAILTEDTPPRPDTLYGAVKLSVEQAVTDVGGVSLRATGVYGPPGPGQRHKWADLFDDFAAGRPVASRRATEVQGDDLAAACLRALDPATPPVLNVSDLMLDRRDLLALWSEVSGIPGALPDAVPGPGPAAMDCAALRALGWQPQGRAGLSATLRAIAQSGAASTP